MQPTLTDDAFIETRPALAQVNDWLRQHRTDADGRQRIAAALRTGPTLATVVSGFGVVGGSDAFLGALSRLPGWADMAIRTIAADALDAGLHLNFQEVLEPLPVGVDHTVVERFAEGDDVFVVVRLPVRLACHS